jgi:hypothetical protein
VFFIKQSFEKPGVCAHICIPIDRKLNSVQNGMQNVDVSYLIKNSSRPLKIPTKNAFFRDIDPKS